MILASWFFLSEIVFLGSHSKVYTQIMPLDRRLFDGKIISSIVYPEFFPINVSEKVANFGCGIGPQAVAYKGRYKRMIGIDLHKERLDASHILLAEHDVQNYETICKPVEATGLPADYFEKALAIDIIEHLPEPKNMLIEIHRVLKPGGRLLVTVPAMHDHYVHAARCFGKLLGRKTKELPAGHWDAHNTSLSVNEWMKLIASTPFKIISTRASTLFPPLHLYGVPRFWFTNRFIHAIDSFLCRLPILKRCGQAYLIVLEK